MNARYYERKARIYRAKAMKLFARGNADKGMRAQWIGAQYNLKAQDLLYRR